MASRTGVGAAALLVMLALPVPAFADVSASDRETARALMAEGDKKREASDLPGALKAFQQADAIMHVPTTGLEVARVQVRLGKLLEARDTLARVNRLPVKPGEPAAFANARKAADALNSDLGARVPGVRVAVTGVAPGVTPRVTIDGEAMPAGVAAPRKVNPGPHVIVASADGTERRETITVAEREVRELTIDLTKTAPPPPPPPPPGDATPRGPGLANGLMYGGFGVGVVGLAVGSITGLLSITKVSSIRDSCVDDRCPPDKQSDIDSAKGLGTVSTIAFVAGGIGVGVGVVGLLMRPKSDAKAVGGAPGAPHRAHVEPQIGLGWLGVRGAF